MVPLLARLHICADPEVVAALCEVLASDGFTARIDALCALNTPHSGTLVVYIPALIKVLLTFGGFKFECYMQSMDKPEEYVMNLASINCEASINVREMAMKAMSLLPPSAVAQHVELMLLTMREADDEDLGWYDDFNSDPQDL
jgi:hypothetical protein